MARATPREHGRLAPLDGLRAVAAVAVVLFHLDLPLARGGDAGVDWFFVLSAFLVGSLLLDQLDATGSIAVGRFLRRRVRRLVPALLGMLVVVLVVVAVAVRDRLGAALADALGAATYVSNLTLAGAQGTDSFFLHTWSLALEMQFYVVLPVVLLATRARSRSPRSLAAAVVAVGITCTIVRTVLRSIAPDAAWVQTNPLLDVDRFALGLGLALALRPGGWPGVGTAVRRPLLAAFAAAVALTDLVAGDRWPDAAVPARHLLVGAATAVIVGHVVLVHRSAVARVLSARPLVAIGLRSYSLYLWHFPIFVLLADGIVVDGRPGLRLVAKLVLTVVATAASYRLLEARAVGRAGVTPRRAWRGRRRGRDGRAATPA